ncbi:MAG: helix-turn-helix domain-containing protein [Psychromonas sp.]
MANLSIVNQLAHIHHKQPWLVMNAAQKFSLAGTNSDTISHFYTFEASDSKQAPFAIPDGCIDVLFNCSHGQPNAEVFGTPLEAINIELTAHNRYFGIRFRSGVMPDILNVSAGELINNHYNLIDLIPNTNQLVEEISSCDNFNHQINLFNQFMVEKSQRTQACTTTQIIENIIQNHGNIKIKDLEGLTGYSIRTLQRKFQNDMGMSPKTYSRIIRCQSAIYQINHSEKIIFSDLAYALGFTDQPHFLREFKRSVKTTPLNYQHRVKDESYLNKIQYI